MAFVLHLDGPVGRRVAKLLVKEIDTAQAALAHRPLDDEAIHAVRKCGKRGRALLKLARPLLPEKTYRRENRCLREVGRRLAPARETAALGLALESLHRRYPDGFSQAHEQALQRQMNPLAAKALGDLEKQLEGIANELAGARGRIAKWRLSSGWGGIWKGLARCHRHAKRAYREAIRQPDHDHRHEWRKRVKDLMYQAQLLRPIWPLSLKAWEKQLEELEDLLGAEHDLHQLRQRAQGFATAHQAILEMGRAIDNSIEWIQRQTRKCGKRLHADSTRLLIARLRDCRSRLK